MRSAAVYRNHDFAVNLPAVLRCHRVPNMHKVKNLTGAGLEIMCIQKSKYLVHEGTYLLTLGKTGVSGISHFTHTFDAGDNRLLDITLLDLQGAKNLLRMVQAKGSHLHQYPAGFDLRHRDLCQLDLFNGGNLFQYNRFHGSALFLFVLLIQKQHVCKAVIQHISQGFPHVPHLSAAVDLYCVFFVSSPLFAFICRLFRLAQDREGHSLLAEDIQHRPKLRMMDRVRPGQKKVGLKMIKNTEIQAVENFIFQLLTCQAISSFAHVQFKCKQIARLYHHLIHMF